MRECIPLLLHCSTFVKWEAGKLLSFLNLLWSSQPHPSLTLLLGLLAAELVLETNIEHRLLLLVMAELALNLRMFYLILLHSYRSCFLYSFTFLFLALHSLKQLFSLL